MIPIGCELMPQSPTREESELKINVLGINICDSETYLGENAQMVDGEGGTLSSSYFFVPASSYWLPLSCQALHNGPFASVHGITFMNSHRTLGNAREFR